MNSKDRQHLDQIQSAAEYLMNGKGNGIATADIVEAMINDVQLVKFGRAPEDLPALVELDESFHQTVGA
jgi:hypothetical protein